MKNIYLAFAILLTACLLGQAQATTHNVLKTEVFVIVVEPTMFNWTYEGRPDQFHYEASLAASSDLPSWINYVFSERYQSGFLYGVPPTLRQSKPQIYLDMVALNRKTYEIRVETIEILIQEKLNPAIYEVHMKIDNLNVADMFNDERMNALKDIFSRVLWKNTNDEIYVTFLKSALDLGARKPLSPSEGEGVVIRLGSKSVFSSELLELQKEVRPLNKMQSCPRNFKRTSVERFFRDGGFVLDWCAFKLIEKDVNNSAKQKSDTANDEKPEDFSTLSPPSFYRQSIPVRSYRKELLIAICIPMVIMTLLVMVLSFIICYKNDIINISDELAAYEEQSTPQRFLTATNQTDTLTGLTMNREQNISPDGLLLSCNHSDSPNSTLARGVHCRPSPPPYVRPMYKPEI